MVVPARGSIVKVSECVLTCTERVSWVDREGDCDNE